MQPRSVALEQRSYPSNREQLTPTSESFEGPRSWKVVRKKDGRMLLAANWTLSHDGETLTDKYTEFAPNGSAVTMNYVHRRTAAGESRTSSCSSGSENTGMPQTVARSKKKLPTSRLGVHCALAST